MHTSPIVAGYQCQTVQTAGFNRAYNFFLFYGHNFREADAKNSYLLLEYRLTRGMDPFDHYLLVHSKGDTKRDPFAYVLVAAHRTPRRQTVL